MMLVIGVLSSWEAIDTNASRRSCSSLSCVMSRASNPVMVSSDPAGIENDDTSRWRRLALIHRRTACRRPAEETKGCASESGIMVLKQKTGPRKGAPDRGYHVTTPTASKSPSTTTAWWPMPG